ncbi:MAG: phosphatase PAP2 family protein [Prevotella sp.]|nr:phosphatase PAP2 family protein [Prevotella sp.]
MLDYLIQIDQDFLLWVNSCHNTFWDGVMYLYSEKIVWVPFYVSLVYVIAKNFSWRVALMILAAAVLVVFVSDQLSAKVFRSWVDRYRPSHDDSISSMVHIVFGKRGGKWSFPSSHAANAWGLAVYLVLIFRKKWFSLLMIVWALLMCYSRMYLGMHFFGDLLVGGLIGALTAVLVWLIVKKLSGYQHVNHWRHLMVPAVVWLATLVVFCVLSACNWSPA